MERLMELDAKHNDLLDRLNELDRRVEKVLNEWTQNRTETTGVPDSLGPTLSLQEESPREETPRPHLPGVASSGASFAQVDPDADVTAASRESGEEEFGEP
jgi:hypothetical protein